MVKVYGGCFNSTIVRLEVPERKAFVANERRFNSTIVRLEVSIPLLCRKFLMFQFYNSSIRSPKITARVNQLQCFNSTIVRLEDRQIPKRRVPGRSFQFYNSSIRSTVFLIFCMLVGGFNSTIVRLEVSFVFRSRPGLERFNSTIVRLEASPVTLTGVLQVRFNSTIVRLEDIVNFHLRQVSSVSILQ